MPSKGPVIIYWDTSVFFGFLNKEKGRLDDIEILLDKAERKEILISTSTITLTEAYKIGGKASQQDLEKIREFLKHDYFRLIALDRATAFTTQEIRQEYESHVDFEDSIHLGTAVHHNIGILLTYDGEKKGARKLLSLDKKLTLRNGEKLRILRPGDYIRELHPLLLVNDFHEQQKQKEETTEASDASPSV